MSRIRIIIDEIAVKGLDGVDRRTLAHVLEKELTTAFKDSAQNATLIHSQQQSRVSFGRIAFEPGPAAGRILGENVARAIGTGLKK